MRNLIKHLVVAAIVGAALLLDLVFNIFYGVYCFVVESEAVCTLISDYQKVKTALQYSYNKGLTNAK